MTAIALETNQQNHLQESRTLALTTGITSTIGMEFHHAFEEKGFHSIGFAREKIEAEMKMKHPIVHVDLLNAAAIEEEISKLPLSQFQQIIWVHSVGKFAFEANGLPLKDLDQDGIDDDVFHANVTTSMHFLRALIQKMKRQRCSAALHFCLFGSTSSDYPTPFWPSFTKSKQLLSTLTQMEISQHPQLEIFGIMAKLSTVHTPTISCHREIKDTSHFLSVEEVVEKTLPHLLLPQTRWRELSIFKPKKEFNPSWYWDAQRIKERWVGRLAEEE